MLGFLKSLRTTPVAATAEPPPAPPARVEAPGAAPFELAAALADAAGFPRLDWVAVQHWVQTLPDEATQAAAWGACERAWIDHLAAALGPAYRVRARPGALLLCTLPPAQAEAALDHLLRTGQRILRVLDGLAEAPAWGHDILIVFDDADTYYRYVARYYPEAGEFAASSGMYLQDGCGHFVTVQADLHAIEPVVAHELTHACLDHLNIPAWLNEGLAVNTERRLCPPPVPADPRALHVRHQRFWNAARIQEFWSGRSFLRNDEGNELSYDLARILVAQFAADWPRFRTFARAARLDDAGEAAACAHLGMDLGTAACALLEQAPAPAWRPRPAEWTGAPERGAFAAPRARS